MPLELVRNYFHGNSKKIILLQKWLHNEEERNTVQFLRVYFFEDATKRFRALIGRGWYRTNDGRINKFDKTKAWVNEKGSNTVLETIQLGGWVLHMLGSDAEKLRFCMFLQTNCARSRKSPLFSMRHKMNFQGGKPCSLTSKIMKHASISQNTKNESRIQTIFKIIRHVSFRKFPWRIQYTRGNDYVFIPHLHIFHQFSANFNFAVLITNVFLYCYFSNYLSSRFFTTYYLSNHFFNVFLYDYLSNYLSFLFLYYNLF